MEHKRVIFVIRMSAIGDVLMAARTLALLRKQGFYPVLVTSVALKNLASCFSDLDAVVCLEKGHTAEFFVCGKQVKSDEFKLHVNRIAQEKHPLLFDVQRTSRSRFARKELEQAFLFQFEKKFFVQKRTWYRMWLIFLSRVSFSQSKKKALNISKIKKISDLHEQAIQKICQYEKKKFLLLENDRVFLKKSTSESAYPYVCLFPGASGFLKVWPKEKARQLIKLILDQTPFHVLICGSNAEAFLGAYLDFPKQPRVHNLTAKTDLPQIIDLIGHAKYVVTNDSFAAHAADCLGVPASVIFGGTSPQFGFVPRFDKINIEYANVSCSPCTRHGKGECRFQNLKCLVDVHPESVFQHLCQATDQKGNKHV